MIRERNVSRLLNRFLRRVTKDFVLSVVTCYNQDILGQVINRH
jgi:hypothetical protein